MKIATLASGMRAIPAPQGFIPSCDGNTTFTKLSAMPNQIHPLLRGEHQADLQGLTEEQDSSPLTRGTQPRFPSTAPLLRFIPSCEGNTLGTLVQPISSKIHPLLRGEHTSCSSPAKFDKDSSPLARGTPTIETDFRPGRGFIPSCEGNTYIIYRLQLPSLDSSPLARGTPHKHWIFAISLRFIPSCEGNTGFD